MTPLRVHPGWFKPLPEDDGAPPVPRVTHDEWEALVERWNWGDDPHEPPPTAEQRQAERNKCLVSGHDWGRLRNGYLICRRCISYKDPEDR